MLLRIATVLLLFASIAFSHETQTVGEGDDATNVIVGFVVEPPYTEERTGLDLIIRRAADESPVENLQESLQADITAPDGTMKTLTLRARYGQPGRYTDDFVLTQPGVYTIRIYGFIGAQEIDLTFESHEVRAFSDLRFP